jgi:hypothetical protein
MASDYDDEMDQVDIESVVRMSAEEDFEEDVLPKLRTLADVRRVVEEWAGRQGNERCWYYPELLKRLAELLEVDVPTPQLPAPSEFISKCAEFYRSESGDGWIPGTWHVETWPEVPRDCVLILNIDKQKLADTMPWSKRDPQKFEEMVSLYLQSLKDLYEQSKPGDIFLHTDLVEVEGLARLSFVSQVKISGVENPLDTEDKPVVK